MMNVRVNREDDSMKHVVLIASPENGVFTPASTATTRGLRFQRVHSGDILRRVRGVVHHNG
jgi:hypothetical protein